MDNEKKTLVLGASMNEDRYSNKAIHSLRKHGHPVVAVGLREGQVGDVPVLKAIPAGPEIDTVTMYLNASNQAVWQQQVLDLKPKRIVFNPGAENPELAAKANKQGIETLEACTLVMLGTGQF